jgi:glycogen debranching enzyme
VAARVLATFARFIDQGMLPNRFPDGEQAPEYNTVDAALWYVEAARAYHAATGDDALLAQLYPGAHRHHRLVPEGHALRDRRGRGGRAPALRGSGRCS